jgi:hypothetical protein
VTTRLQDTAAFASPGPEVPIRRRPGVHGQAIAGCFGPLFEMPPPAHEPARPRPGRARPARLLSISDANGGMAALGAGHYAKAITLFTHAIDKGQLTPSDKELAYVKRAQAFAAERDVPNALADLKQALALATGLSDC